MIFGYFGIFWRIFFGYTGIPLPPLADPEIRGGGIGPQFSLKIRGVGQAPPLDPPLLLTGLWVSMCMLRVRSMQEIWRAQKPLECSPNFPSASYLNTRFLWVMDALVRNSKLTRTWGLSLLVLSACSMGIIWSMLALFYLIRQLIFLLQVCYNKDCTAQDSVTDSKHTVHCWRQCMK